MSKPMRARRRRGLLNEWAGESIWRRFVAWLAQSAILLALGAFMIAIVWLVLLPLMIQGFTNVMSR